MNLYKELDQYERRMADLDSFAPQMILDMAGVDGEDTVLSAAKAVALRDAKKAIALKEDECKKLRAEIASLKKLPRSRVGRKVTSNNKKAPDLDQYDPSAFQAEDTLRTVQSAKKFRSNGNDSERKSRAEKRSQSYEPRDRSPPGRMFSVGQKKKKKKKSTL
eukprot:Trichotokara_eunicae@DN6781_c0_g1_i1.p1